MKCRFVSTWVTALLALLLFNLFRPLPVGTVNCLLDGLEVCGPGWRISCCISYCIQSGLYTLPSSAHLQSLDNPTIRNTCLLFLTQHRLNTVAPCHQSKSRQHKQSWYQPVSLPPSPWDTSAGLCPWCSGGVGGYSLNLSSFLPSLLHSPPEALMPCVHPMGLSLQG